MAATYSDTQVMRAIRTDTNGAENKLLEHLQAIEEKPHGQCAVHIHLSQLQKANRKPDYIRIAERCFDQIILTHMSELYILGNFDMILMCPNEKIEQIDKALRSIRSLFQADPLIGRRDISGEEALVTWYDLEEDYQYFKEAVVTSVLMGKRQSMDGQSSSMEDEKLTPHNLDNISKSFKKLDARPLMRHQSAVQIGANGQGKVLFREYYVSIGDLRKVVAPNVDLLADAWLFRYLTTILDQRVLHMLRSQAMEDLPRTLSLNLNVQTINTKDFQLFDHFVGEEASRVIIEFQPTDVFADIYEYEKTRDMLQYRGYKVLIDSLQPLVLDYYDPSLLRADFYKIAWGDRLGSTSTKEGQAEIRELIHSIGVSNVIISLVDSEEAVKFGLQLGVQRFQGFFIDHLVERMAQKNLSDFKGL